MRLRGAAPAGGMGRERTAAGPAADSYGRALLDMIDGITGQRPGAYSKAAASMERLAEAGSLQDGMEFWVSLHSALCYDLSGRRDGARRMYERAGQRYGGELDSIVKSGRHGRGIAEGLVALGRDGDVSRLSRALGDLIDEIKGREEEAGGPLQHDDPGNYIVLLSTLILVDDFFSAVSDPAGGEKAAEAARDAGERVGELHMFSVSPFLHFAAGLYLHLIGASYERFAAGTGAPGLGGRGTRPPPRGAAGRAARGEESA